jgi:hypothetical protein
VTAGTRYRLAPLLEARRAELLAAEAELTRAAAELGRAREAEARAAQALREHEAKAVHEADEAHRAVSGLDLQRAAAYAARRAETAGVLRQTHADRLLDVHRGEAELARCRTALAEALSGLRALERDRERFEREARRQAEAHEQLEVEERRPAMRGDRGPGGNREA